MDKDKFWQALRQPSEKNCGNCKHKATHCGATSFKPVLCQVKRGMGHELSDYDWEGWEWDGETK